MNYPIIESIGCDFSNGGYGLKQDNGWDGYKIILPESPIFENLNIQLNQIISIPTREYDSAPIIDVTPDGIPIIDTEILDFFRINILGFSSRLKIGNEESSMANKARNYSNHTYSVCICSSFGNFLLAVRFPTSLYNNINYILRAI